MGLFDLVFDELSKEIKEAPGWLSLVALVNALLFLPPIKDALTTLQWDKEETTLATIVAMGLFFVGDILDSAVFPRERSRNRLQKFLKTAMLLLAAVAIFLLLTKGLTWAALPALVWAGIIALYRTRDEKFWSVPMGWITTALQKQRKGTSRHTDTSDGETGFRQIVPGYAKMTQARDKARADLNLGRGIYNVSKALVRKSGSYTFSIWFPNEAGKFVRSFVIPTLIASGWLLLRKQWAAPLLIPIGVALLFLYCWLKGLHIRKLYEQAATLAKSKESYREEACPSARVLLWQGEIVDSVAASSA